VFVLAKIQSLLISVQITMLKLVFALIYELHGKFTSAEFCNFVLIVKFAECINFPTSALLDGKQATQ